MPKRIKVNISKLPDNVYREALALGLKKLMNNQQQRNAYINEIWRMAKELVVVQLKLDGINPMHTTDWHISVAALKVIKLARKGKL